MSFKKYLENFSKIFSKKCQLIAVFVFILVFAFLNIQAQTISQNAPKRYSLGAKLLSKSDYDKLPKANWDSLKKYSNPNAYIAKSTTAIKILTAPPIGDQGTENSCVGWATGYAALGILSYPKYNCWDIAKRSPNYVYNQIKLGSDCSALAYTTAGLNIIKNQGACSYNLMPYVNGQCTTLPNSDQTFEALRHTIFSWSTINPTTALSQYKSAIDLGYPVVVTIDIYQSFYDMWSSGGIWTAANSGAYYGSHAVCIVGYDDTQSLFKVQNSWGTAGGDQGYFWVSYNLVSNGIINEAYIVSGINGQYPETVSGPTLICSTGTFTLNNPPAGCTISWHNSSNLSLTSTLNNTATFTRVGNGSGWVQPYFSACSFSLPQYSTWVGTPEMTNPIVDGRSYYTGMQICPGNHYIKVTPVGGNPTTATWIIPSGIPYLIGTNQVDFTLPSNVNGLQFSARSTNSCGTGSYFSYYLAKKTSGCPSSISMTLYPNPAMDNVNILLKSDEVPQDLSDTTITYLNDVQNIEPSYYTIKVYNSRSSLVATFTRSGKSFNIPLSNLNIGNYIIELSDGKNSTRQELIIKR
jgi:hypothetical protein